MTILRYISIDKEVSYIMENSSSDFDDILKDPITLKEIEDILIALPNNKAPGDDGITNEHIKHSGDILVGKLAYFTRKSLNLSTSQNTQEEKDRTRTVLIQYLKSQIVLSFGAKECYD